MLKNTVFALGLAAQLGHGAAHTRRQVFTTPAAFDGRYLSPAAGEGNQAFEWWWVQAMAPEVNGTTPSIEVIFYEGFAFTRGDNDPKWRVDVSGVRQDGSTFFVSTPLTVAPTVTAQGEAVQGDWDGFASFSLASDYSSMNVTLDNQAVGLTGTIELKNLGTRPHGPCSDSIEDPPYFSSLAAGRKLSAAEKSLYTETGWAIIIPKAAAAVDVTFEGERLTLDNAVGYHDHNWGKKALDQYAYTWVNGQGSCGPYDVTFVEVQPLGSQRHADVVKGFLAFDGDYLQNQCQVFGTKKADTVSIELTGQTTDAATGQQVPTGLKVDYTLGNGTHYVFDLVVTASDVSQIPYHRWQLGGSGGRVGGPQYDCLVVGDWLNPGLAPYEEGGNVFEEQASKY